MDKIHPFWKLILTLREGRTPRLSFWLSGSLAFKLTCSSSGFQFASATRDPPMQSYGEAKTRPSLAEPVYWPRPKTELFSIFYPSRNPASLDFGRSNSSNLI